MTTTIIKRPTASLHRKVAIWQRAACGLFALGLAGNAALYGLYLRQEDETAAAQEDARHWQERHAVAVQIQQDAVAAYGELLTQVEAEQTARAEQMAAYEAVGAYRYVGECTITAYCCESEGWPHICGTGTGLTATGVPVAPGMVSIDPDIIPLGSTVIIDGVKYLAADTGVDGLHVDVALPTHAEALAFGVQTAEVWVVEEGGATR